MKIVLNNKETELDGCDEINVKDLLDRVEFNSPVIMVRVNDKLVKKTNHGDFQIKPGDNVIAIPLVGGG